MHMQGASLVECAVPKFLWYVDSTPHVHVGVLRFRAASASQLSCEEADSTSRPVGEGRLGREDASSGLSMWGRKVERCC